MRSGDAKKTQASLRRSGSGVEGSVMMVGYPSDSTCRWPRSVVMTVMPRPYRTPFFMLTMPEIRDSTALAFSKSMMVMSATGAFGEMAAVEKTKMPGGVERGLLYEFRKRNCTELD